MEATPEKIVIAYAPILKKICLSLGLPDPVYNCLDLQQNIAYVLVPTHSEPTAFSYVGRKGNSLEESCESAAKKMVLFLVQEFNVKVDDVNLGTRVRTEKCAHLFKLMRSQIEKGEKELPDTTMDQLATLDIIEYGFNHVSIDYIALLRSVVQKLQILVTPIEVAKVAGDSFTAWFTIEIPTMFWGTESVVGDRKHTADDAKQSVAKKAINLMMAYYKFEIEDVNYHLLPLINVSCKLERESYLTVKARVSGYEEDQAPRACIVEQDLVTPRARENQIIAANNPPLPPKKRKAGYRGISLSGRVPTIKVPVELESVFKRPKME